MTNINTIKTIGEKKSYRQIAEEYFQKKLLPDEVVHHIDGNHDNNDPENLVIMKRSQHSRLHGGLMHALDEWRKNTGKPLCGDCLYTRLYRKDRGVHDDFLIESLFSIFHIDSSRFFKHAEQDRGEVLEFCRELYDDCTAWQRQHDHDCYANKNMHVVKLG